MSVLSIIYACYLEKHIINVERATKSNNYVKTRAKLQHGYCKVAIDCQL